MNDIFRLYIYDINNSDHIIVGFNEGSSNTAEEDQKIKDASILIKKLSKNFKITVILIGHTSQPKKNGDDYSSNYELSEGRANEVKMRLIKEVNYNSGMLDTITWHVIPTNHHKDEKEKNNELAVDVYIEPEFKSFYDFSDEKIKKQTFLEYMYFTYSLL